MKAKSVSKQTHKIFALLLPAFLIFQGVPLAVAGIQDQPTPTPGASSMPTVSLQNAPQPAPSPSASSAPSALFGIDSQTLSPATPAASASPAIHSSASSALVSMPAPSPSPSTAPAQIAPVVNNPAPATPSVAAKNIKVSYLDAGMVTVSLDTTTLFTGKITLAVQAVAGGPVLSIPLNVTSGRSSFDISATGLNASTDYRYQIIFNAGTASEVRTGLLYFSTPKQGTLIKQITPSVNLVNNQAVVTLAAALNGTLPAGASVILNVSLNGAASRALTAAYDSATGTYKVDITGVTPPATLTYSAEVWKYGSVNTVYGVTATSSYYVSDSILHQMDLSATVQTSLPDQASIYANVGSGWAGGTIELVYWKTSDPSHPVTVRMSAQSGSGYNYEADLSGLTGGTDYQFYVRATKNGQIKSTATAKFTTAQPVTIASLTASQITSSSALISFSAANVAPGEKVTLYYKDASSSSGFTAVTVFPYNGQLYSAALSNLSPNKTYTYYVEVTAANGASLTKSSQLSFKTPDVVVVQSNNPPPVLHASIQMTGPTTAIISGSIVSSSANAGASLRGMPITIQYCSTGSPSQCVTLKAVTDASGNFKITLPTLSANTQYTTVITAPNVTPLHLSFRTGAVNLRPTAVPTPSASPSSAPLVRMP